ncbi:MAG TPA: triose-phosphate isomerase [Gemmatimonadaceae bacterium]|jgi:triosephosphate isomerase|nr:triose-phosphate isomerase [Gemmatimonadaceae bacterium]
MQRPVFAANWKMNHGPSAARAFVAEFTAKWSPHADRTVLLFPPALSVSTVVEALSSRSDIGVGVQNIWTEDRGAFTGENSAPMARDAGARFVLVGHSERRHVFGETDEQAALKCAAAERSQLTPILCVGELLEQRQAGETESVVLRQLKAGLAKLSSAAIGSMAVAYEPVWAIGTGKTATPGDASVVHAEIRKALETRVGAAAGAIPILYGGSVSTGNAAALLAAKNVDGLLVGGASLKVDDWALICGT